MARQGFSKTLEELGFTKAINETKMSVLAGQFAYAHVEESGLDSTLAFDETGQFWKHPKKIGLTMSGFIENPSLTAEVTAIGQYTHARVRVH